MLLTSMCVVFQKQYLCIHVYSFLGASENVNKTNFRFVIWILMKKTGLTKILLNRLGVGHSHFDVDQHHAVFSIAVRKNGSARRDVHSLSQYEQCAWKAHSDLRAFVELGKLFDFKTWLAPMRTRFEEGIQDHMAIEFERIDDEIFFRSKPNMGLNVPFSARRICWPPPPNATYRNNPNPILVVNRPPILNLQPWKDYPRVRVNHTRHLHTHVCNVSVVELNPIPRCLCVENSIEVLPRPKLVHSTRTTG